MQILFGAKLNGLFLPVIGYGNQATAKQNQRVVKTNNLDLKLIPNSLALIFWVETYTLRPTQFG